MNDWRRYVGKPLSFFKTEIDGRIVKVSANLRPKGNIMWQLATKTKIGENWCTPWLSLEEMEQLGFLFLVLSEFCKKPRFMNKETFEEIQAFKKKWNRLVDRAFRDLKTRRTLLRELKQKCGIS